MKKFIFYLLFFAFVFNIEGNSNESYPSKQDVEEVFNIGKMLSHDKKFTLFFKSRKKAILARGEEFNYIVDYPQDLYILNNINGKISSLITYDWFPQKAKSLSFIHPSKNKWVHFKSELPKDFKKLLNFLENLCS